MVKQNTPAKALHDAKFYYTEGNALVSQKKFDEAIEQYKLAIAADDKYYLAYYSWGRALADQEKYDEAIEKYEEVIRLNDKYANTYNSWGLALTEQKKYDEAIEQYKLAIAADDKYYRAYYNWGRALAEQKKYDEAISKFKEAIQPNDAAQPHDKMVIAHAYNGWGLALANQKKFAEAIEKYNLAISADNKNILFYHNLALALFRQGKYAEVIARCDKVTQIDDKYVDAYIFWGAALTQLGKHQEAIEKYRAASSLDKTNALVHRNWGVVLAALRQYDAAIEKYKESIEVAAANQKEENQLWATYSQHNIAELIWRQGKYKESRKEWDKTRQAYDKTKHVAIKSNDADYFNYFGNMLQSVMADSDAAENTFKQGLKLDPNHVGILTNLVAFYVEKKDSAGDHSDQSRAADLEVAETIAMPGTSCYWMARESFVRAKEILENSVETNRDTFFQLGSLYLNLGSYITSDELERAERNLLTAFEKDKESANVRAGLGVLYARMENYQKAVQFLTDAVKLESDDLTIRSSLAEAQLKAESTAKAETEYKRILGITQGHVESHIGLGEVYKTMGDANEDGDLYYRAIQEFTEGMRLARTEEGSKKLTGKSLAAAYYSRGYARVKLYEASKVARDESLLNKARADFRRAQDNDSENYKAARALEKIGKRFGFRAAQRLIEKLGPWILFSLSLGVFAVTQVSIYKGKPIASLDAGYYALLTFGSLLWMVASISLPQLLKLKVAGIELEKSAVEQITTPTSLEISK